MEAGKKEVFGSIVIIYTNAQRSVSFDQMLVRKNFTFGSRSEFSNGGFTEACKELLRRTNR